MNSCRICLSTAADKDISHLKTSKDNSETYKEILLFCLDIQVTEDTQPRTICIKCYNRILSFYEFKKLALKNDKYFKSVVKLKRLVTDGNIELNSPGFSESENEHSSCEINEKFDHFELKIENFKHEYESDDELLSDLKKATCEPSDNTVNNARKLVNWQSHQQTRKPKFKNKKVICGECGKSVGDLKKHSISHIPLKERKPIQCKDCDKTFTTSDARYKHYRIKHLGIKPQCDICNKVVVSLRTHQLLVHNKEDLPLSCVVCNHRFLNASILKTHMETHNKDQPYECNICHKKYQLRTNLILHKRSIHEQEKNHLCQYCSKSFFSSNNLKKHLRMHTKETPFKCSECEKEFTTSYGLKIHLRIHTGERKCHCKLCGKSFISTSSLYKHNLTHSKEKTHPCRYCGRKFARKDHCKVHEYTKIKKLIDICRICFSTAADRDISFETGIDDSKPFREILTFCLNIQVSEGSKTQKLCLECYNKVLSFHKFKTLAQKNDAYLRSIQQDCIVKLEALEVIDEDNLENEEVYNDSVLSECDYENLITEIKEEPQEEPENDTSESEDELLCDLKIVKYESLQEKSLDTEPSSQKSIEDDTKKKRERKRELCEQCGKCVKDLKKHYFSHIAPRDRDIVRCKLCPKTFSNDTRLYCHNKYTHDKSTVKELCDICSKEVNNLWEHKLRMHTNKEHYKYSCVICNDRFYIPSRLKIHMNIHTKDHVYECDHCQKQYYVKLNLITHIQQVHPHKKLKCKFCSKKFCGKYHLDRHIRSHTKEKPYKCSECGKGFAHFTSVVNHMPAHTGERFRCPICGRAFTRKSSRSKHMLSHSEVKNHSCRYCEKRFVRRDHLRNHEATHKKRKRKYKRKPLQPVDLTV